MKNTFKFRWLLAVAAITLVSAGCLSQVKAPETSNQPNQTPAVTTPSTQTVIRYQGQDGKTALDLLKAPHQVTTKTFSGIGEYVDSIDGVVPDSSHFWAFYINGQQSQVGAGQYSTKSTDQIEWRLEKIEQSNQ